ncbi:MULTISPECIES: DUF1648 domain-containing protein [unclassified Leifsonia]|uniref:DUF1648 domain-containing protein n=1 Tax=unclassified Leifsonia TaxID=2663824 RepID=UPI0006FA8CB7|nr:MULTISPECIES: DUF1648 domain-containing protein [unclassified Leifsonia]KQX05612.1 hypothetical protein ASC59_16110 [Leifsonia sp. Root1293]KRA09246.1 hypothetical protein ASD61_16105 [Leifsonia sp. Root60]
MSRPSNPTDPTDPRGSGRPAPSASPDGAAVEKRSERRVIVLVGLVLPLGVVAASVALMIGWLPRLPDPVATHWGPSGEPDAFGSPWAAIGLLAVIGVVFSVLMTYIALRSVAHGAAPASVRLTVVFSPVFAVLLSVIIAGSLGIQVGLDDATEAGGLFWIFAAAVGAAAVTGLLTWLVLPSRGSHPSAPSPEPAVALEPGERAVWTRTVSAPRGILGVPVAVGALGLMPVFLDPAMWWSSALLLLLAALISLLLVARVTVDGSGLVVRSLLGFRMLRVRLADVVSAASITVDPLAEFGGWGMRFDSRGRRGVVLASGPAMQVERVSGGPIVVTVQDAPTGAALLNGLVAQG